MLIAAALLLFTLLCIALSDDRAWDNVTRSARNSLVFDGRHREYGAYELRQDYDRRFVLALFLGIGMLGAGVGVSHLFTSETVFADPPTIDGVDVDLTGIIDPPPPTIHPPTPPAPPPSGASGTPSIIVIDSTRLERDTTSMVPPAPAPGPVGPAPGPVPPMPPGPPGGGGTLGGTGVLPVDSITPEAFVEERPVFPGGERAMHRFIQEHVRFPETYDKQTKIYVAFVVDTDGTVMMVEAKNGKGNAYAKEAERLIRQMPRWAPAKMTGRPVKCRLVLPINFETK